MDGDGDSSSVGPLASLTSEPEVTQCYCGKERDMRVEVQCCMCSRFYHQKCVEGTGDIVSFMTNYQFFCKRCNASGSDSFSKKPASFSQMCHTALANYTYENPDSSFFSLNTELIPYIEEYWEHMTTAPRRAKQSWHSTISKTMMKDPDVFCPRDDPSGSGDQQFALVNPDLKRIGPNCQALFKLVGTSTVKAQEPKASSKVTSDTKTRGTKRKQAEEKAAPGRARKGEINNMSAKITPTGYPSEHPFNKDGYRYILAEPDMHAPNWDAFDQSMEWAGKPIPGYLYRTWLSDRVELALHDRGPQLRIGEDNMSVTGDKGYSMIRATHGVNRGRWYFEATIRDQPEGTHARIGWAQSLGNLQAPCGYDKWSYSWRSRKGTVFHQSRGKNYSKPYAEKDVVGFFIDMPDPAQPENLTPEVYKDKPLVKFKNHLYYEEKDEVQQKEKELVVAPGSKMIMYRNGRNQGVAFEDVFEGTYFPCISIYKNATVSVNFGPKFRHQPRDQSNWRPMSESVTQAYVDHAMADMLYLLDKPPHQLSSLHHDVPSY